jgi:hypothetical protein
MALKTVTAIPVTIGIIINSNIVKTPSFVIRDFGKALPTTN